MNGRAAIRTTHPDPSFHINRAPCTTKAPCSLVPFCHTQRRGTPRRARSYIFARIESPHAFGVLVHASWF